MEMDGWDVDIMRIKIAWNGMKSDRKGNLTRGWGWRSRSTTFLYVVLKNVSS